MVYGFCPPPRHSPRVPWSELVEGPLPVYICLATDEFLQIDGGSPLIPTCTRSYHTLTFNQQLHLTLSAAEQRMY